MPAAPLSFSSNDRRPHRVVAALLRDDAAPLDAAPGVDPTTLARWTITHRIAPFIRQLAKQRAPALAALLDREVALSASLVAVREHRLGPFFAELARREVIPILFKGLGVAYRYYPSPELRPLGDVDLLLGPSDLGRAIAAAEACGFAQKSADPVIRDYYRVAGYNVPLQHPVLSLLELHHQLYRDCAPGFVAQVVATAQPMPFLGHPARMVTAPSLFVLLATHFCVSDPGLQWLWLMDLALIGRGLGEDDWRAVDEAAVTHGLQLYVLAVLRLLDDLWNVRVGAGTQRALVPTLRWPERVAFDALMGQLDQEGRIGDRLIIARRAAVRPVRGGLGILESLVPHRGAVCLDLGVSSDAPFFALHRLRHIGLRLTRAVTGLGPLLKSATRSRRPASGERPSPYDRP